MLLPTPRHPKDRRHSGGQCGEVSVVSSRPQIGFARLDCRTKGYTHEKGYQA